MFPAAVPEGRRRTVAPFAIRKQALMKTHPFGTLLASLVLVALAGVAWAQGGKEVIPHAQDKPPGPPRSPQEALRKMTVPEGFVVELVASEPEIVNPVALTFDERGRAWITESLEYPRRDPGPGRDRIKLLEDTDGDGRADKFTVFAEGLNIPSGIAVGYGGVWVANSPEILFLQDTDGDGRADKREVIVRGFGRTDTHELPNSFTWGPDGWLYGLNGVFNPSHVRYPNSSPHYRPDHPGWQFTCAMFRIHPRTREFQVFAEGTSNPWGIALDDVGSFFISACVIDHLWHIVESGYYHRQGGPYPPFTWKIESIVKHKHQKAAYCGIHYFDSDAYPPAFRHKLYMGNIHGGCINSDKLQRAGSTYFATPEPDFLTAHDAWFMPVAQKTGPDGCLYILDWYDRYHCYQDANRDPAGIDRLKGRLYRVRYAATPRAAAIDLAALGDDELIEKLSSGNGYHRDIAQRLLAERNTAEIRARLEALLRSPSTPPRTKMHALFARLACGGDKETWAEDNSLVGQLIRHTDPALRAWGVRAAGNWLERIDPLELRFISAMSADETSPDVLLQIAILSGKRGLVLPLFNVLQRSSGDELLPRIVWQNLHPLLEREVLADEALHWLESSPELRKSRPVINLLPRIVERLLGRRQLQADLVARAVALGLECGDDTTSRQCLAQIAGRVQSREIQGAALSALRQGLEPQLAKVLWAGPEHPLYADVGLLAAHWKDAAALSAVRTAFASESVSEPRRLEALTALIAAGDPQLLDAVAKVLAKERGASLALRGGVLAALGRLNDDRVAAIVLQNYSALEAELRPRAIELLTQRTTWSRALLEAISRKEISPDALNANQVRRMLASGDEKLAALVHQHWGALRWERNPQREQVVAQMRALIRRNPGDATRGWAVWDKVCGQCHKLHGRGQDVGPEITSNGRASFEQLLSNVFDPSLVIGASYQARTILTSDGRALTGLPVEESDQRVVLKVQGGKLETIPRAEIEQLEISNLSMMPEGVEKQLTPQELADLFALLTLDKPPTDPTARRLAGVYDLQPRETTDPAAFNELLAEVAPGFHVAASGEGGVALLQEHRLRPVVVRTHPLSREKPCVLRGQFELPKDKRSQLAISVSHDPRGDWQLVVRADDQKLLDKIIGGKTTTDGWAELTVDLTPFAGRQVTLELENRANDWSWEFGYWGKVEIVSE
jgi:putative membrane-bound dehydrogenase-like protein